MPPKQLVFKDEGLDLQKFPGLMPKRLTGIVLEFSATPSAGGRFECKDVNRDSTDVFEYGIGEMLVEVLLFNFLDYVPTDR